MFRSEKDHKAALDIIASVVQSLESGPLERLALFSPIITLESKFSEPHRSVYVFCPTYLEIFNDQGVKYVVLQSPDILMFNLSQDGKEQLKYIEAHRPQHLV